MRTQKADIRELLAESLKQLTLKNSFAKITVKDITCLLYTSDAADEL